MPIKLNEEQKAMLNGERGTAKKMAMQLVLDLAAMAGSEELVPIESAHLSGVSPLTGGLGLRKFLARLAEDDAADVAVSTTLNAAGCDVAQFEAMRIVAPNFLEHSREIVALYEQIGVRPTQSCIPYEWEGVVLEGTAAWAESNAICYGNTYTGLLTNRESGLSALASALTGYTPRYGLLTEGACTPNIEVFVTAEMQAPADFSLLGDWIGMQKQSSWHLPYGPMPVIKGLPRDMTHEQRKALTAASANYGCPLLYIEGVSEEIPTPDYQATLHFTPEALAQRYAELAPRMPVSLITIGCPQASVGEIRAVAELVKGKRVTAAPEDSDDLPPLWVFTSAANKAIAEKTGLADIIRESGALLLENTCPEVVPYDKSWVKHILTNSMKAEHYIKSGLNGIPTSVMTLADCIAIAVGEQKVVSGEGVAQERRGGRAGKKRAAAEATIASVALAAGPFSAQGAGLPSQDRFEVIGEAFVTAAPITLLGFVNRETGVIEEEGHPANGESLAGKIAIFPKGTGSTVAPYVLLELFYRGRAPLAIVNTTIDQQCAPACSLEGIPYGYSFDADVIANINHGDRIALRREGDVVSIEVLERRPAL